MSNFLLPHLPAEEILAAYAKAPGNELAAGKMSSPESSAALVANTFGFFLRRPHDLPPLPNLSDAGWPAENVALEECARFPWRGGYHPWLDAMVETSTHLIGIESKRYEPFRSHADGTFSKAYERPVWGDDMGPYEGLRDQLNDKEISFRHLDAFQLVKHAFGLRTEGGRRGKIPVLLYLYAEPQSWPDGRGIKKETKERHKAEIGVFLRAVQGAEVRAVACSYGELLDSFKLSGESDLRDHAGLINQMFFNPAH